MDVFGAVMGGLTFTQGFFNYRNASRYARQMNELNDRRRDFNIRQVRKAYEKNYGAMVGQFALMLGNLKDQKAQAESSINMTAQQLGMSGVDITRSSYLNVADSVLENELKGSFNVLLDEEIDRGNAMYLDLIHKEFEIEGQYNSEKMSITKQKIDEQAQAGQQIIQGAIRVATSVGGFGMGGGAGAMGSKAMSAINGLQSASSFYNNMNMSNGSNGVQYLKPQSTKNFFSVGDLSSGYSYGRRFTKV